MSGAGGLRDKILVVDDEPDFLQLLTFDIQKRGYQVIAASNGEEALAKIKVENPHLIICDIKMPKMDGYTFVRILRKDPSTARIPLIVLSAYDMKDVFEVEGVKHYVVKSSNMAPLFDTISQTLAEIQPAR